MPFKDPEKQREAVKRAVQKSRGITLPDGITDPVISRGITEGITSPEGITSTPEILLALTDPEKRKKLQAICDGLEKADLLQAVYRGAGKQMIRADKLLEMLKATVYPVLTGLHS